MECILASGMITSSLGLREVPHLTAPAGLEQLARGIRHEVFPSISPIPFLFIPGVKNRMQGPDDFQAMDMMRGEETEAAALLEELEPDGLEPDSSYLLVLPGSHTKFAAVRQRQIAGCLTTLTGELLSVLTKHTLWADTLGKQFAAPQTYRKDMVLLGYETARSSGLARAAFAVRILGTQAGKTPEEAASYLLGAVLEQDLRALKSAGAMLGITERTQVILSGKEIFRQGFYDILRAEGSFRNLLAREPDANMPLAARGALAIYSRWKELENIESAED